MLDLDDLIELVIDVADFGLDVFTWGAKRREKKEKRKVKDAVSKEPWEREDRKPPWEGREG